MRFTRSAILTKVHLVISIGIVIPVAFIYGFAPERYFNIVPKSIDEANILMGIFGLYLCFAVLWTAGVISPEFLKSALVSNVIFMLGLGFGRSLSMILHGLPSVGFSYGTVGELILGFYGLWVLKNYPKIVEWNQ